MNFEECNLEEQFSSHYYSKRLIYQRWEYIKLERYLEC